MKAAVSARRKAYKASLRPHNGSEAIGYQGRRGGPRSGSLLLPEYHEQPLIYAKVAFRNSRLPRTPMTPFWTLHLKAACSQVFFCLNKSLADLRWLFKLWKVGSRIWCENNSETVLLHRDTGESLCLLMARVSKVTGILEAACVCWWPGSPRSRCLAGLL